MLARPRELDERRDARTEPAAGEDVHDRGDLALARGADRRCGRSRSK
jgi:hypothetical protein